MHQPSFEAWVRSCVSNAFKVPVSFSMLTVSRSLPSLHLSPFSKPGIEGEDQRDGEGQRDGGKALWKISQILLTRGYSRSSGLQAKCVESASVSAQRLSGRICWDVCHRPSCDGNQACSRLRGHRGGFNVMPQKRKLDIFQWWCLKDEREELWLITGPKCSKSIRKNLNWKKKENLRDK